jgi:hypothetical protein
MKDLGEVTYILGIGIYRNVDHKDCLAYKSEYIHRQSLETIQDARLQEKIYAYVYKCKVQLYRRNNSSLQL